MFIFYVGIVISEKFRNILNFACVCNFLSFQRRFVAGVWVLFPCSVLRSCELLRIIFVTHWSLVSARHILSLKIERWYTLCHPRLLPHAVIFRLIETGLRRRLRVAFYIFLENRSFNIENEHVCPTISPRLLEYFLGRNLKIRDDSNTTGQRLCILLKKNYEAENFPGGEHFT